MIKTMTLTFLLSFSFSATAKGLTASQIEEIKKCQSENPGWDKEECIYITSPYLTSHEKEQWSFELVENGCKENLTKEIKAIVKKYKLKGAVAIYPKTVSSRYFNVLFSSKDISTEYQFEYWTTDDLYYQCLRVEPLQFLN